MRTFWQLLYSSVTVPLFWLVVQLAGMVRPKVRRGIRGRRFLFVRLNRNMQDVRPGPRVWFHASSMGEFEQAKPIIRELKQRNPGVRVIVSFFSPSGYEHSRRYPLADVITYMPLDTRSGARRFLDLVSPDVAVMIRYDIWPNHIWELRRRGIPTMIASATMRRQTVRRLPLVRNFHRHLYNAFTTILTVSDQDRQTFDSFRLQGPRLASIGDTRFDQVILRSADARKRNIIPAGIVDGKKVVVAGSTWPEDEGVLLPALYRLQTTVPELLTIIVPHEPTEDHLENLETELADTVRSIRFSALNEYAGEPVIIVDSVGILMVLYASAHIAFVGGGFRQGIHNVLEAAVYGIPVVFGPRHRNSQEPLQLVERGGAFIVSGTEELERTLRNLLENDAARRRSGECATAFVSANTGATGRFLTYLEPLLRTRPPHDSAPT